MFTFIKIFIVTLFVAQQSHAQIESTTGDIIFLTSGTEQARITTDGVIKATKNIQVGSTTATCSASNEGSIRYNSTTKVLEFCDSLGWAQMLVTSTSSTDTTPDSFDFTNLTDQGLGQIILSNTENITGFDGPIIAEVSGGGSPAISINGGAWLTAGNINPGESLRVRMNASPSVSTALVATVTVGTVSDNWTVTTKAGQTRIFQTSVSYVGGSIGGLSGADAICQSRASLKGYAGSWKAILSDSTANAKDRLTITYPVVRASDSTVVESINLWNGSLENKITPAGGANVWSGTDATGEATANHCNDWSSTGATGQGGFSGNTSPGWIDTGSGACTGQKRLHCIEQ
ncbi:MAG: hypothetical protein CMF60_05415 [Magnetococcales bacterium]|nr:hypothetical protein [Magnetococcales bacterium]|tara:strand:- start:7692 stop:8729 length:1038 start_codon:yes stop_codon:yes gene_type:complete